MSIDKKTNRMTPENKIANVLSETYFDPKKPGSFSGYNSFRRSIKNKNRAIKNEQIKNWLIEQDEYTLHKPVRKKFLRNQIIVSGIDDTWQADLIDMQNVANENDNYKYLLAVIDVFSKYAWVTPLKNKTSSNVINAFEQIFKSRKPKKLHTDQGTEFLNKECQKFLKKNEIKLYFIHSDMKASIVERFNRTIKEKMWRYFTWKNNKRYVDILDDLLSSYNNTYHRSIKTEPINVTAKNEEKVFETLFGFQKSLMSDNDDLVKPKYKIGDKVRITKYKRVFEKGYTPNWRREIFIIDQILYKKQPVYILRDLNKEIILGVFYESELQKVIIEDNILKVDKILKTRTKKGETQYFVSWQGYPSSLNSWINKSDII